MDLGSLVSTDLGVGIGLRTRHYADVLSAPPDIDWFEALSENHMQTGGRPRRVLEQVAERFPVALHGVSMNLGSVDPLDREYLAELRALRDAVGARFVSDHLCWTGVDGVHLHDLLPIPYTEQALRHLAARVAAVQDLLEAPLVLENPSTYLRFGHDEMDEPSFLAALCRETGCGLLVDVNNVHVCARNHGFDPFAWLDAVPGDHVVQIHLAGHRDLGTHLLDTHDGPVCDDVWSLYAHACRRWGPRSTLLEWDDEIPPLEVLVAEARKADRFRNAIAEEAPR